MASIKNTTFTICNGSPEAEIEDCLNKDFYSDFLKQEFGVDINCTEFRNNTKWTARISNCFKAQGKLWNESTEKQVKLFIANLAPEDHSTILCPHKRSSIDALISALENIL